MMIEADNPKTFPEELRRAVEDFIAELPPDSITKIFEYKIEYGSDVRCAIEDYMSPFRAMAEPLYKTVLECLEQHSIKCFHATKVLNESQIWNNGLKANDWEGYSAALAQTLRTLGVDDAAARDAIDCVQREHVRKFDARKEKSELCFFGSMSLLNDGESPGYDQFCESIGGELARWALEKTMPEVFQVLKENGKQVVVEFELPFSEITHHQKDIIAYQFICHFAAKHFWKFDYAVKFDGMTQADVPPQRILEVEPYTKEVDYT